jgi:hypothetical protein
MQAKLPDRTTLETVLDWLDWKILAILGILLLVLLHPKLQDAFAALMRRWKEPPTPQP